MSNVINTLSVINNNDFALRNAHMFTIKTEMRNEEKLKVIKAFTKLNIGY